MSSCLILQDKYNYYIGADTACSTKIQDVYYRVNDDMQKIFQCNEDVFFCSGNVNVVHDVVSWIYYHYSKSPHIDAEALSIYLRKKYLQQTDDVFDIEVVICRQTPYSNVLQLSQYNEFNIVTHLPRDNSINVICCGYKTEEMFDMSQIILRTQYTSVNDVYQTIFDNISDNKVGGMLVLYQNGSQTMRSIVREQNIQYVNIYDTSCHLVLAKAVIAGYIEGSKIRGADLKAGYLGKDANGNDQWMFEADEDGNVYMCNRTVEFSYDKNSLKEATDDLASRIEGVHEIVKGQIDDINSTKMYRVEISTQDAQIFKQSDQKATLTCTIYSWDKNITDIKLTDDGYPENVLYMNKTYASYARWIRTSNDTTEDAKWNRNDDGTYKHTDRKSVV